MKNFEDALYKAKNVEREMNMSELNDDIIKIALKYSSGTEIKDLTVREFEILCNLITEIIKKPTMFIQ